MSECPREVLTRTLDQKDLEIPNGKLDLYVLGFPCTPWSLRGQGCGFQDPNAKPFWAGISTLKVICPKTFVMENARAAARSIWSA